MKMRVRTGRCERNVKAKHECAYCHKRFVTITEHMIHVIKEHDRGYVDRGERSVLRPSSCWSCASDIWPDAEGRYVCACGFDLLAARTQAQARADEGQNENLKML